MPTTPLDTDKPQPTAPKQNAVISTARSVSVSRRGPRAPARPSVERYDSSKERFGEHQKLTPTVVDIRRGSNHQHKKSENAVIESL
jgi:hypothetical protein